MILRPLERQDGERVRSWRNTPEVSRYMYTDHVITAEEHGAWLEAALTASDRRIWIVEHRGAPVGLATLDAPTTAARRGEWAYYLADPAVRGQGVGACVEFLVIDYAFAVLGLNKLWCEVLAENEAVWRLHLGFGFLEEARLRQHVWKNGRFQDVLGLGLLAEDWTRARGECEGRLNARSVLLGSRILERRGLADAKGTP